MERKSRGRIGEMPEPQLRENDVLVEVHAASVNLLDSKIRSGEFKLILPYRLPLILGNDVAGSRDASGTSSAAIQGRRRGLCTATSGSDWHIRRTDRDQ